MVSAEALAPSAPGELLELADPIEQWLLWEEQANLLGFRVSTRPVEVGLAAVPRGEVELFRTPSAPESLARRFLRGDRVFFARHPLNCDPGVAYFGAPDAERWLCRFTSSRTLVVPAAPGEALFSLKLATDHPHPNFHQPEKTKLREEGLGVLEWVSAIERVDRLLGPPPGIVLVMEALVVLAVGSESGFLVRDLRLFQDGHHYLPALSLPWVGPQIARRSGERFGAFWARHYAEAVGRAKARLLARYGLWYETPNPQNVLVQLDRQLRPTGTLVFRDLGDAYCATDTFRCSDRPWSVLGADLRPETANSFWAFGEAGERAVAAATLEAWYAAHDRAYFAELAATFPALAPPAGGAAGGLLEHWNRVLRRPDSEPAVAAGLASLARKAA